MLVLSATDRQQIEDQARAAYPGECCGLLVGAGLIGAGQTVTRIVAARNLRTEPDRFELDPAVHLKVQRDVRGSGERVIGHYHSHPDGRPEPSPIDLANAHDPDLVWVIAATDGDLVELAAFRLEAGAFVPLKIRP